MIVKATAAERRILEYALHRYDTDPEFHARVHYAGGLAHRIQGGPDQVTLAAAVGLAMEWVDLLTMTVIDR